MSSLLFASYGLFVSILSFLFFYFFGWLIIPLHQGKKITLFPVITGAAVFCLICWFGTQWNISFFYIIQFIFSISGILACIRGQLCLKIIKNFFSEPFKEDIFFWCIAYLLLYWLVYIFLPLPNLNKYLPLSWTYNIDILNYINVGQSFILPSANTEYLLSYYYQTPAVFYFLAWISLFFHHNVMMAAMPTLYSVVAAIGMMITYYCRNFFYCSKKVSLSIAAIVLSGSFFRLIIDCYFLSSLMGILIWLVFLVEILKWQKITFFNQKIFKQGIIVIFMYQTLLLLLYPVLFIFMAVIFCIVIGLKIWMSNKTLSWKHRIKRICFFIGYLLLVTLILIFLLPDYFIMNIRHLNEFAHRTGIMELPLLSIVALLGIPRFFIENIFINIGFIIAFFVCLSELMYLSYRKRIILSLSAWVMSFLLMGALIVYLMYYFIEAPISYQPWKLASYFILPLCGVFWALVFRVGLQPLNPDKSEWLFSCTMLFFIIGNFLWVPIKHHEPLAKKYEKLSQLNELTFRALYVNMATPESTFLSVFFIRDKHLYLLSPSFYYYPQVSFNSILKRAKIFEETKQCHVSDEEAIKFGSIGCLYNVKKN